MQLPLLPFRSAGYAVLGGLAALTVGCGGSSASQTPAAPAAAQGLIYTAPATTGYKLVRGAASTPTHLVLDLVGPQGSQLKGVVLTLTSDGVRTAWGNPGGVDPYLKAGGVLDLGSGTPLAKSQLAGAALQAGLFQKGSAPAATLGTAPIFSLAVDLRAGAKPGAVPLAASSAQILNASGRTQTITVAVGTLSAQ